MKRRIIKLLLSLVGILIVATAILFVGGYALITRIDTVSA
jgi:hypothetical protein